MHKTDILLHSGEAARRLGISPKALRLYEQHGLLKPRRSEAGWRFYGAAEMARAAEIAALRRLGMSLAQTKGVLAGHTKGLDLVLARHQQALETEMAINGQRLDALRQRRVALSTGESTGWQDLLETSTPAIALDLPWPWAGERFEIGHLPPVTWLTGPLGSGKTRLAEALAASIPGARFIGLDRQGARPGPAGPAVSARVAAELAWLREDGATESEPLLALLALLCDPAIPALVFDLIEDGLDEPSQDALGAWLRRYQDVDRPIIAMTRSSAVLDLESVGPSALVLYCPANHSPPVRVLPVPGAAGYEAVASCLAPPEVRQRTAGMVAAMP
jgi:DNA-binding transcriptional MerR regulator